MARIDAHQHYWSVTRQDYGWLTPETGILYRDYLPEDLRRHLTRHGVTGTVLVQAAPTVEETEYMLELYDQEPGILGVVGWLDFESAHFLADFTRLRERPGFVGVRPMIQDLPTGWMLKEQVIASFRLLAGKGFPVDLQLRPRLIADAVELMRRVPELRVVVDHLAKPDMGADELEPWASDLSALAACPNVMCKLSGMVAEVPGQLWSRERIVPYARHVLAVFGAKRVMFGSDWPVCLISATYDEVHALALDLLPPEWDEGMRAGVFGDNAIHFYDLKERLS